MAFRWFVVAAAVWLTSLTAYGQFNSFPPGTFLGKGAQTAPNASVCAQWTTWSTGLTIDATHQTQSQNLICGGVTHGWFAKCDRAWIFANQNSTAALKDFVSGAVATLSNAPVFTADSGYAGNGTNATVQDLSYTYNTTGPNGSQNSTALVGWSLKASADNGFLVGNSFGFQSALTLNSFGFGSNAAAFINGATPLSSGTISTGLGMFTASRTSSVQLDIYQNAINIATSGANTSTLVTSASPWFLGSASLGWFGGTIAFGATCGGLTSTDVTNMYGDVHPYMQVIAGQP